MQLPRSFLAVALVGLLAAACGGASATQGPAGATQNPGGGGGEATDGPGGGEATQNPGGGGGGAGGGDATYGKVHIEISGPVTKNADFGFIPAGSMFGGDQGSVLNFAGGDNSEVVSILVSPDQPVVVSYAGTDFQAAGATCTTTNWNVGASSASGSFECDAPIVIMASGGTATGAKIKGSFDAHK